MEYPTLEAVRIHCMEHLTSLHLEYIRSLENENHILSLSGDPKTEFWEELDKMDSYQRAIRQCIAFYTKKLQAGVDLTEEILTGRDLH